MQASKTHTRDQARHLFAKMSINRHLFEQLANYNRRIQKLPTQTHFAHTEIITANIRGSIRNTIRHAIDILYIIFIGWWLRFNVVYIRDCGIRATFYKSKLCRVICDGIFAAGRVTSLNKITISIQVAARYSVHFYRIWLHKLYYMHTNQISVCINCIKRTIYNIPSKYFSGER